MSPAAMNAPLDESLRGQSVAVLLLKTPSTPVDNYFTHFSNLSLTLLLPSSSVRTVRFRPSFVPVLANRFLPESLSGLRDLFLNGAFASARPPSDASAQADLLVTPATHPASSDHAPSIRPPQSSKTTPIPSKRYGGLILTSQRSSEALIAVLSSLPHRPEGSPPWIPSDFPVYTIGPATSRVLLSPSNPSTTDPILASLPKLSQTIELSSTRAPTHFVTSSQLHGSNTGNGEALAAFICNHYASSHMEDTPILPILFPVARDHRPTIYDTLTSHEIPVDELIVYETGPMPGFETHLASALDRCQVSSENHTGEAATSSPPTSSTASVAITAVPSGVETTQQSETGDCASREACQDMAKAEGLQNEEDLAERMERITVAEKKEGPRDGAGPSSGSSKDDTRCRTQTPAMTNDEISQATHSQIETHQPWVLIFSPTGSEGVMSAMGLDPKNRRSDSRTAIEAGPESAAAAELPSTTNSPPPLSPSPPASPPSLPCSPPPHTAPSPPLIPHSQISSPQTLPSSDPLPSQTLPQRTSHPQSHPSLRTSSRHPPPLIATIGPTTRDFLLNTYDLRVDVCAETPTPEGIAKGICDFILNRHSTDP